jgi:GMP synthase-like glutamine amidotransferase
MASTKFKKRDLNRFRKIYPYLRRKPVWSYCANKEVIIEIGSIVFTNSNSEIHTFSESFSETPTVTAIAYDSDENNTADVNVFVSSLSTANMTIETSQSFTGTVQFHAIMVAK